MNELPQTIVRKTRNGVQTYAMVSVEPCIKRDGGTGQYAIWQSTCRTCGQPFTCTSGTSKTAVKKIGFVHCPAHRIRKQP